MRTYSIIPIIICTTMLFLGQPIMACAQFYEPLPPPAGNVIHVDPSQTGNLTSIVSNANSGDTILFADGTYLLNGIYFWVSTPGLTLRSASGNREAVILDGNYQTTEIVTVNASHVTIADLTLKRARNHAVHVVPASTSGGDISHARIHNVHIIDPGQQAIKINPTSRFITQTMARSPAAASNSLTPDDLRFWRSMAAVTPAVLTDIRPGDGS